MFRIVPNENVTSSKISTTLGVAVSSEILRGLLSLPILVLFPYWQMCSGEVEVDVVVGVEVVVEVDVLVVVVVPVVVVLFGSEKVRKKCKLKFQ